MINQQDKTISILNTSTITTTGSIISPITKIPNTNFRILTKIHLKDGSRIQRQNNILISPTSISISIINQPYTLTNNSTTSVAFTIYNHAQETLIIRMCVLDTLQLIDLNGLCREYTVANMSSSDDTLDITIDKWLEQNNINDSINTTSGSMTFAITAINSIGEELKNYNKIPFYIQTREYNSTLIEAVNETSTTFSSKATFITYQYYFIFLFVLIFLYYDLY
ncbi:unnamed protein product [Adineta steineri]|uniref:Uncharacterized protein n=1 Tax=Adineta steineri TaxID=433720 RepID=A0A814QJX5_9BILA|nr:unnamed protein product [Adineta steineri]CAF3550559.1 unnamed protein product [Adineta steineri]